MSISILEYVSKLPNKNIVAYSIGCIKDGALDKHYKKLQKSKCENGIVQVGPKIASFYLRDIVSLFDLESKVSISDDCQVYLQPVDVWVKRFALNPKIGIVTDGASDKKIQEAIQEAIVNLCKGKCSPVQFNQGIWYAGYYAFDLLLDSLAMHGV